MCTILFKIFIDVNKIISIDVHAPYSWDKWPLEDERSACGYVGLTNLGATCYMATCMQHLYMIPEARKSVLEAQVWAVVTYVAESLAHFILYVLT